MIVCGKCGFTQPKDVYCANCGINLERYKPEKPPKFIQLLKDPYFQISFSIIVAIAAFFIFINKPTTAYLEEVTETSQVNPEKTVQVEIPEKLEKKIAIRPEKTPAKAKGNPKALTVTTSIEKLDDSKTKPQELEPPTSDSPKDLTKAINKASYSFYEVIPSQVDKYFTNSTTVEASVILKNEFNLQSLSSSKLPMEKTWELAESKDIQLNYMAESIEEGELRGIKFSFSNTSSEDELSKNINIRINANIPNKEGSSSSIDWSRTLLVEKGNVILIKIQLPYKELPASFMEDNYNSPLSIMNSSHFFEQKTQLLTVVQFE